MVNALSVDLVLASCGMTLVACLRSWDTWSVPWHPSGRGYTIAWIEGMEFGIALDRPLERPSLSGSELSTWANARSVHVVGVRGLHLAFGEFLITGAFGIKSYDYRYQIVFPLWLPIVLGLVAPSITARRAAQTLRRKRAGLCEISGYDLRASPARFPECGAVRTDPTATPGPSAPPAGSGFAT
jgi:hypothetical protein